ncbi:MAG: phosphatase PAP2 family protein [Clostridiaceae bacterium]
MRIMHEGFKEIKKKHIFIFLVMAASMVLYQVTNRPIGVVHILALPFEDNIPLIKEFIVLYHATYPFMVINVILFLLLNQVLFLESAISITLGNVFSFFTYLIYQTEVPRPEIFGYDLFSEMLRITYRLDRPFNGFPSQHVLTTTIILIAILRSKYNKRYQLFSIVLCAMILLSTVFVKQHTLLDVFGGVVYGSASYIIVAYVINIIRKKGRFRREK